MVAIQRLDNLMWAIPGGMVDAGEKATATLKREFIEEALNSNKGAFTWYSSDFDFSSSYFRFLFAVKEIENFFDHNGSEIYSGYVDDPRNTDNAWIETTAYNFHDESGAILNEIKFQAGDDAGNVKWMDIDQNLHLYANHREIVGKVATHLNSHWWSPKIENRMGAEKGYTKEMKVIAFFIVIKI